MDILINMILENSSMIPLAKPYPLSLMNLMYALCEVLCTNWTHVLASNSLRAALMALTARESETAEINYFSMRTNIADPFFFYLLRLLSSA